MRPKPIAVALAASTLFALAALAQTKPEQTRMEQLLKASAEQQPGQWRVSKMVGLAVFSNEEQIGDVKDIIIERNGRSDVVVVGTAERNVGIPWSQVRWMDRPRGETTGKTDQPTTGPGGADPASGRQDHPNHAVVTINKEQLEKLPPFRYLSEKGETNKGPTGQPGR